MERHWEDSAASLTTGMILHACYTAAAEDRVASLADLAGHFTRPGVEFRETLNEMVSYPHVFALDGRIYMAYLGDQVGRYGFGLAVLRGRLE